MTTLSISMVTYQLDKDVFLQAINSLEMAVEHSIQNKLLSRVTLTIVDNGDDLAFLKTVLDGIVWFENTIIDSPKNIGFGRAHNLALKACKSDIHLVLNPDAVIQKDALTIGCKYLKEQSGAVMVTPFAREPSGRRAYLCKRYPSIFDLFLRGPAPGWLKKIAGKRLGKYECRDFSDCKVTRGVDIASGCYMLVRTDAFKKVSGFNEVYFLYFEDFELSLRISRVGTIDYLPMMRIVHCGGNTYRKGLKHIGMFCRSALIFFKTNGWRLT